VLRLAYEKPSALHSAWLESMLNYKSEPRDFLDFAKAWGPMAFCEADFEMRKNKEGRMYISLAESYVLFLAKAFCSVSTSKYRENTGDLPFTADEIIGLINLVACKIKGNTYFDYYKSQLLITTKKTDEARLLFSLVVAQKPNDSWVWGTLADFYPDHSDERISLICKALLCTGPETMKVKLHEKLAFLLAEKAFYPEARHEFETTISIRENNNWPVPSRLQTTLAAKNMAQAGRTGTLKKFYETHAEVAFDLAFTVLPSQPAIITDTLNENQKETLSYALSREE
jgi:hypothetical protein